MVVFFVIGNPASHAFTHGRAFIDFRRYVLYSTHAVMFIFYRFIHVNSITLNYARVTCAAVYRASSKF